jgi:hypothetical protein
MISRRFLFLTKFLASSSLFEIAVPRPTFRGDSFVTRSNGHKS